jgi:hypothetical protein
MLLRTVKNLLEQVKILAVTYWKQHGLFHSTHEHDATLLEASGQGNKARMQYVIAQTTADI